MIPVFINNRDIFTDMQQQIRWWRGVPDTYIVLVDNHSTYGPLRNWLSSLVNQADEVFNLCHYRFHSPSRLLPELSMPDELVMLPINMGPRAPSGLLELMPFEYEYYFLSESDIDYRGINRETFLPDLQAVLTAFDYLLGAGISYIIDDLPKTEMAELAKDIEGSYLHTKLVATPTNTSFSMPERFMGEWPFWVAPHDTAGVLRRMYPGWTGDYAPAVRSSVHMARHLPWYFIPSGWTCPHMPEHNCTRDIDCGVCWEHCEECPCHRFRWIPQDYKWYRHHCFAGGTTYTARAVDKSRPLKDQD